MGTFLYGNTLPLVTDKPGERTFPMSPEDKTAVKLMIAALDAYGRARKKVSGAGWAKLDFSPYRGTEPIPQKSVPRSNEHRLLFAGGVFI